MCRAPRLHMEIHGWRVAFVQVQQHAAPPAAVATVPGPFKAANA